MPAKLPESTLDLFERPILCALCTVNAKGKPHTVPVWCDFDGTYVCVNAPVTSKKVRDMKATGQVAILIIDPQQAYHWVEVRGHVAEIRDEAHGAREDIDRLSIKYTGHPYQGYRNNMPIERITFLIEPDVVNGR